MKYSRPLPTLTVNSPSEIRIFVAVNHASTPEPFHRLPKSNINLHQHIDLQLLPGSLVLLIGPNGIGKSVLLKTICGLQTPIEGTVHVNHTNIHTSTAEIRASLTSILLATPPSIEQMTVYDMVVSGRQRFLNGWRNPSIDDENAVNQAMEKQASQTSPNRILDRSAMA